jgi:hypothetical protein
MISSCLNGSVQVVVEFFNIFFHISNSILHTLGLFSKLFLNFSFKVA